MTQQEERFAPFRPHTIQKYLDTCTLLTNEKVKIDDSAIQYALESLRTKALIWKSARGVYAIEDSQHVDWLQEDYAAALKRNESGV